MTYRVEPDQTEEMARKIEEVHSDLATKHGRDNVFVAASGDEIISIVGDGLGLIDPIQVSTTSSEL